MTNKIDKIQKRITKLEKELYAGETMFGAVRALISDDSSRAKAVAEFELFKKVLNHKIKGLKILIEIELHEELIELSDLAMSYLGSDVH